MPKSKLRNGIIATKAFGFLVLSVMTPTMFGSSYTPKALAQPIPPPDANNQGNATGAQAGGGEEGKAGRALERSEGNRVKIAMLSTELESLESPITLA